YRGVFHFITDLRRRSVDAQPVSFLASGRISEVEFVVSLGVDPPGAVQSVVGLVCLHGCARIAIQHAGDLRFVVTTESEFGLNGPDFFLGNPPVAYRTIRRLRLRRLRGGEDRDQKRDCDRQRRQEIFSHILLLQNSVNRTYRTYKSYRSYKSHSCPFSFQGVIRER